MTTRSISDDDLRYAARVVVNLESKVKERGETLRALGRARAELEQLRVAKAEQDAKAQAEAERDAAAWRARLNALVGARIRSVDEVGDCLAIVLEDGRSITVSALGGDYSTYLDVSITP